MGLFPNVLDEARSRIDIAPKYSSAEVFDKRAVDKNQVVFHGVGGHRVKPIVKEGKRASTEALPWADRFSVFYSRIR